MMDLEGLIVILFLISLVLTLLGFIIVQDFVTIVIILVFLYIVLYTGFHVLFNYLDKSDTSNQYQPVTSGTVCPNCGSALDANGRFCTDCGYKAVN